MRKNIKLGLAALAIAAAVIPLSKVSAQVTAIPTVDLTETGSASGTIAPWYSRAGDNTAAIFQRDNTQPTGTGVFDPFNTVDSPGNTHTEQGYNTSTANTTLPFDDLRNHWNKNVQKQALATVTISGKSYYVFTLDANETGNGSDNRFLSIDNIQLYTSATGSQTSTSTINGPKSHPQLNIGTLRWALNSFDDPTAVAGTWVKIDSTRNTPQQKTSGSGSADMVVYIPTTALDGALPTDYVYFFNQMGFHYNVDGDQTVGTGAEAGFEEWAGLIGPNFVPDGGSTLALLGSALTALAACRRSFAKK